MKKVISKTTDFITLLRDIHKEVEKNEFKGKKTQLVLSTYHESISQEQRAYYFGVIIPRMQDNELFRGWTLEECHKWLKANYLANYEDILEEMTGQELNPENIGEVAFRFSQILEDLSIANQSKLNTMNFENYASRIRSELSKKGVYIPKPNEW